MIPLGVDLLRFFFPHWSLSRIVGKNAHRFLFSAVIGLFFITIRYYYFVYLPLVLNHESPFSSLKGLLHIAFSSWLWLNVLGNYYHTIMHSGFEGTQFVPRAINFRPALAIDGSDGCALSVNMKECISLPVISQKRVQPRTGVEWQPTRTHFCSICCCSIMYWDHHCPFTGNCVGLHNYSNFFIGLCYGVLGEIYAITITWPFFYDCTVRPYYFDGFDLSDSCKELGANSYIFLPSLIGFWLFSTMLLLHIVLLLADLSTYDILKNWDTYPMAKFVMQRIYATMYLDEDSRFQVLIVKQRKGFLWYLVPVRNSN